MSLALPRPATLAGTATALSVPASAAAAELWSGEYWAEKSRDNQKIALAMYRRHLGAPQPSESARPVLFLVHGSSGGAMSSFDLTVPGHGEYSTMNVFARAGFDVWTMDHEGYGKSSRTDGNSDIASGVEDLKAAVEVVAHETGQTRYSFMGGSSGAIRAGAFAMVAPDRVAKLMLAAFSYTGKGSPTLAKRAERLEYYRTHNRRLRDRAMIESIFTRDRPGTTDPAVPKAMADAELVYGDTVPTGTYLDMTSKLPLVDPTKVTCPVCILSGEYDGIATDEDLWDFFRQLPNGNRQFVIIAGAAHSLGTSKSRFAFWHAMQSFLSTPAPPAI